MHSVLCLIVVTSFTTVSALSPCSDGKSSTFEKYSGFRPGWGVPVFLYTAGPDEPSLTGTCTGRCRETEQCAGVAIKHSDQECVGYGPVQNMTLHQDNDASFFLKVCLKLEPECTSRYWAVDNTPGYHLHSEGRDVRIILNVTSAECSEALSDPGSGAQFRSAQWVTSLSSNVDPVEGEIATIYDEEIGDCILNRENRITEPESYRVANFRTFYKENQCRHDFPASIDRCSYEEYFNQTLKHSEISARDVAMTECKSACEREDRFVCRGFTWSEETERVAGSRRGGGYCALHSADILTTGSWLLRRAPGANYYRRVICLNISVECTDDDMVVTYRPHGVFRGRLYVPGRGERCGADATSGGGPVTLTLPYNGTCDVNLAYAVSKGSNGLINKTMAYAMLMVQNNPIIQTAGDRWVRVGCAPGSIDPQQTHTLDAALLVAVDSANPSQPGMPASASALGPVPASAVFNTTVRAPQLTMYVVRASAGEGPGTAVSLGELLEMRVETTEEMEIEAFHLVASSRLGDSSVLLLDNKGCSTGQVDFPRFLRSWHGNSTTPLQRLSAKFKAFRFPTSHVVRFTMMVRFCVNKCAEVRCDEEFKSRAYRDVKSASSAESGERTPSGVRAEVKEESASTWEEALSRESTGSKSPLINYERGASHGGARVIAQSGAMRSPAGCGVAADGSVPVELELVVGSKDLLTADNLVRSEHTPETQKGGIWTSGFSSNGLVCMHELLVVALVLVWLIVQLLLLVGCCVVVKRYRKFAEMSSQKDYHSFDNVGFDTISTHRRVHWPDQNVDILHVN